MATAVSATHLDGQPLAVFRPLFASLMSPDPESVAGTYSGRFTGPAWLPAGARAGLTVTGFRDWRGKVIRVDGAINVLRRRERFVLAHPMYLVAGSSALDGRPVLSLHYLSTAPLPWRWMADEVRWLDESTLLGMTRPQVRWLPRFALPFLLQRSEQQLDQL